LIWEQFNIRAAAQKNWLPEGVYEEEMAKYKPKPQAKPEPEPLMIEHESDDNGQMLLM
jgi:hypothetical protein